MPRSSTLSLNDLLAPLSLDEFFRTNWEQSARVVKRDGRNPYSQLLSLEDIDQIIAFTRPRFTDPTAFSPMAATRTTYVRGVLADQAHSGGDFQPGIAEVRQAFEQGKSIVIMSMQHRWGPIAELCRNLESVFHCPVHANMYLTPPGSQGFAAHYDPHEVFALQLDGTKVWRVYDEPEVLPLPDAVYPPRKPRGESREYHLQPGDLLYIPRGHIHEAFTTTDSFSFHLTVGVNVYRWVDLLQCAVSCAAAGNPQFRESIPGGALPPDRSSLDSRFQELLHLLSQEGQKRLLFEEAFRSLGDQFFRELAVLPARSCECRPDLDSIDQDTRLEKCPQAICRVVEDGAQVAIEFPGNRLTGPSRIAPALTFIAATEHLIPRDLPGGMTAEAKVVLVRRLVRIGLLTVVAENDRANHAAAGDRHALTEVRSCEEAESGFATNDMCRPALATDG